MYYKIYLAINHNIEHLRTYVIYLNKIEYYYLYCLNNV